MRFVEPNSGLEIFVNEDFLKGLYEYGILYYPEEFGGILVGHYSFSEQSAYIEDTILPQTFTRSKVHFERGSQGLRNVLEELHNRQPNWGYLGEWHTHPNFSNQPSVTDRKAMKKITNSKSVLINNPILLILSIDAKTYDPAFFVQVAGSLNQYQLVP